MANKSEKRSKPDVQRSSDWASYLSKGSFASETFMEGIEDLPLQERETEPQRLKPRSQESK
jgi:hypothetical protein